MTVVGIIEGDKFLSSSSVRYLRKQLGIVKIVAAGGINDFLERGLRETHLDKNVIDLDLPCHQSVDEIPFLRQQFADVRLVVNFVKTEFTLARKAFNYGADGFLCKPITPPKLCFFLYRIVSEGVDLCAETSERLVNIFSAPVAKQKVCFSINTVRFHINNIL